MDSRLPAAFLIAALAAISGCNGPQSPQTDTSTSIPDHLTGVWQAQEGVQWGFQIEPNGAIPKLIHSVAGPINAREGGIYQEGPQPGTFMQFDLGTAQATYDPATELLAVHVVIDHFRMVLPTGELAGHIDDYFEGPVSEDGSTWQAKWWGYSELEGGDPPDRDLIEANPNHLVFQKLDLEALQEQNRPQQTEQPQRSE